MAAPPQSPTEKSSYAGAAWQMMYNAKAAVTAALRKDLKQTLDTTNIHALGQAGKGEEWLNQYCRSVQYFSYRNKLPTPIGAALDHDAGWGCMVRTGQMMLCVALKRAMKMVYGGSSGSGNNIDDDILSTATFIDGTSSNHHYNSHVYNQNNHSSNNNSNGHHQSSVSGANLHLTTKNVDGTTVDLSTLTSHEERVKAVVGMFRDIPQADFSIYAIVNAGAKYHIQPGEWFNATSLALSLKHLIVERDTCLVTAVHGKESTVELSDVIGSAALGKPVLVMVSVMLGINNISKNYFPAVHEILGHETSVGIVGGKPKKSMYFFASQKETLFMLDPHYVQPAFTHKSPIGLAYGNMDWVPMGEADSSMLLCFLLEPNEVAIEKWAEWVEKKIPTFSEYPSFCISRRKMKKQSTASLLKTQQQVQMQQHQHQHTPSAPISKAMASNNIHNNINNGTIAGGVSGGGSGVDGDNEDFDTMDDFDANDESPALPRNKNADPTFQRTPPMGPAPVNQQHHQPHQSIFSSSTSSGGMDFANNTTGGLDLDDLLGPSSLDSNGSSVGGGVSEVSATKTNNHHQSNHSGSTTEEIGFDDL